jgi:hypothetical protein
MAAISSNGLKLQASSFKLQASSFKLQASSFKKRFKLQVAWQLATTGNWQLATSQSTTGRSPLCHPAPDPMAHDPRPEARGGSRLAGALLSCFYSNAAESI